MSASGVAGFMRVVGDLESGRSASIGNTAIIAVAAIVCSAAGMAFCYFLFKLILG